VIAKNGEVVVGEDLIIVRNFEFVAPHLSGVTTQALEWALERIQSALIKEKAEAQYRKHIIGEGEFELMSRVVLRTSKQEKET